MVETADQQETLLKIVQANDTTIISDRDHGDDSVPAYINRNLEAFSAQGVRHLYLEHDPKDSNVDQLKAGYAGGSYAAMLDNAERLGIRIHLYDDRSKERDARERFPDAAAFKQSKDPYARDPEALISSYSNPSEMRDFLAADRAAAIDPSRNNSIINNISDGLSQHPREKSLVLIGGRHISGANDVDEGLRKAGHQVTTVEPPLSYKDTSDRGQDLPDFLISTKPGNPVFYKANSEAESLTRLTPESNVPWRNIEPLGQAEPQREQQNNPLASALKGFDCASFSKSVSTNAVHYTNAYNPSATTCNVSQPSEATLGARI